MTVSIIIDILVVLMLAGAIALGIKKGFIGTVISLVRSFIAFIAASTLSPWVSKFLYDMFFSVRIKEAIENALLDISVLQDIKKFANSDVMKGLEEMFGEGLLRFAAPSSQAQFESLSNLLSISEGDISRTIEAQYVEPILTGFINGVVFVVIFTAVAFALKFVIKMLRTVKHVPLVGAADAALGAAAGLLQGVIFVYVLYVSLGLIITFGFGGTLITTESVANTILLHGFYAFLLSTVPSLAFFKF